MLTHSSSFARERRTGALERTKKQFSGFYTILVEIYTKEFLRGFLPCGFPEENLCVLVFLCSYVFVHVVLSVIF